MPYNRPVDAQKRGKVLYCCVAILQSFLVITLTAHTGTLKVNEQDSTNHNVLVHVLGTRGLCAPGIGGESRHLIVVYLCQDVLAR